MQKQDGDFLQQITKPSRAEFAAVNFARKSLKPKILTKKGKKFLGERR